MDMNDENVDELYGIISQYILFPFMNICCFYLKQSLFNYHLIPKPESAISDYN